TAGYPGEKFAAEVFFVARSADPKTRRVDALARNGNEDERLKPGTFAKISIEAPAPGGAILLPESSVLATEEGFVAYVVEQGRARHLRRDLVHAARRLAAAGRRLPGDHGAAHARGRGPRDHGVGRRRRRRGRADDDGGRARDQLDVVPGRGERLRRVRARAVD